MSTGAQGSVLALGTPRYIPDQPIHPARTMTEPPSLPVLDDHMHLDPRGKRGEALKEFQRAGGTHAVIVHKPYEGASRTREEHREAMELTLQLAEEASEASGIPTYVVAAPHPAELTMLLDAGASLDEAAEAYRAGLAVAAELYDEGRTVGLGEIGRPHYPVEDDVLATANTLFQQALALCGERDCAAVLHTEPGDPETFLEWATWADKAGLDRGRVVKHFSPPITDEANNHGLVPSLVVSRDTLEAALEHSDRFLMETDYMDDPDRPGAVMGPKLVPRRTRELHEAGLLSETAWKRIHIELPRQVYGIDTLG